MVGETGSLRQRPRGGAGGAPFLVVDDAVRRVAEAKAASGAGGPVEFLKVEEVAFVEKSHRLDERPADEHRGAVDEIEPGGGRTAQNEALLEAVEAEAAEPGSVPAAAERLYAFGRGVIDQGRTADADVREIGRAHV